MSIESRESRSISCTKCGKTERERFFGEGFKGWVTLKEIATDRNKLGFPILCLECSKKLCIWLEEK